MWWKSLIGGLISPLTDLYSNYQERKKVKLDSELRIKEATTNAAIRKIDNDQMSEQEWNTIQAKNSNSSWKDEYWTIVLSIPMIGCFIPQLAPYIKEGFDALAGTPDWYKAATLTAIAAAFGYRKLIDYAKRKK